MKPAVKQIENKNVVPPALSLMLSFVYREWSPLFVIFILMAPAAP